jgi:hypothetical protein
MGPGTEKRCKNDSPDRVGESKVLCEEIDDATYERKCRERPEGRIEPTHQMRSL